MRATRCYMLLMVWNARRAAAGCSFLLAFAACGRSAHHGASEGSTDNGGEGTIAGGTGGNGDTGGVGANGGSGGSVITDGGSGARGGSAGSVSTDGGSGPTRGGSAGSEPMGGFSGGGVAGMGTKYPCAPSASGSGTVGECTNGFWHRPEPVTCILPPRRMAEGGAGGEASDPTANTNNECWFDSDCNEQPNGYCVATGKLGSYTFRCHYACSTDADCAESEACSCDTQLVIEDSGISERIPICLPSSCRLDSECQPGFACLTSYQYSCLYTGSGGFFCQTSADTCGPPNSGCAQNQSCTYVHDHFECADMPLCGGF